MPKFSVKTPDGVSYDVDAPEGATERDAIAYIASTHGKASSPSAASPAPSAPPPPAPRPAPPSAPTPVSYTKPQGSAGADALWGGGKALFHHAERAVAPTVGGWAGGLAGAEAGAAAMAPFAASSLAIPVAGEVIAPTLGVAGALAGGLAGAGAGGWLSDKAQSILSNFVPDQALDYLGGKETDVQTEEKERPLASFAGGLLPTLGLANPFGAAKSVGSGAGKLAQFIANPNSQRVLNGILGGGFEAGSEAVQGEKLDPAKIGMTAGASVLADKPTALGRGVEAAGRGVGKTAAKLGPAIGSGFVGAGQALRDTYHVDAGRAGITPEEQAKARDAALVKLWDEHLQNDPTGNSLRNNPAEKAGKPITAAEAGGSKWFGRLRTYGRRAGTTTDTLSAAMTDRQIDQTNRIASDFGVTFGIDPALAEKNFYQHTLALRKQAKPAYDAFYAIGGMDGPELRDLMKRHSVQKALARAVQIASDEGVEAHELGVDEGAMRPLLNSDGTPIMNYDKATGKKQPVMIVDTNAKPLKSPTAKTWDYVKRGLDDLIEDHRDSNKNINFTPTVNGLITAKNALRDQLVAQSGGLYGEALARGGDPLRLEETFQDAEKLMNNTTKMRDFETRVKKLGPAEKEALAAGIVADAQNRAKSGQMRLKSMTTPLYAEKLKALLGDKAQGLIDRLEMEVKMQKSTYLLNPDTGSQTFSLTQGTEDEAIDRGGEAIRRAGVKLATKGPKHAVGELAKSGLKGFYEGAKSPVSEAERNALGELLQLRPSELAEAMEKAAGERKSAAAKKQMKTLQRQKAARNVGGNVVRAVAHPRYVYKDGQVYVMSAEDLEARKDRP